MSVVFRSKICGKVTKGYLTARTMRTQSRVEPGEIFFTLKNLDKVTFDSLVEARVMPTPTSQLPEEREFVVDTRASSTC